MMCEEKKSTPVPLGSRLHMSREINNLREVANKFIKRCARRPAVVTDQASGTETQNDFGF